MNANDPASRRGVGIAGISKLVRERERNLESQQSIYAWSMLITAMWLILFFDAVNIFNLLRRSDHGKVHWNRFLTLARLPPASR
jgi:hypothetical protein